MMLEKNYEFQLKSLRDNNKIKWEKKKNGRKGKEHSKKN